MNRMMLIVLAFLLCAAMPAAANPVVTVYAEGGSGEQGDTVEVSLSAENDAAGMAVDLYVGVILPNGEIWSTQYDGWSFSIEPWIPNIYVPEWFEMGRTPFWTFEPPCEAPPIDETGNYCFAALLTYPGTLEYVSAASVSDYSYQPGSSTDVKMVSIPGGSFLMGSPDDESGRHANEGPQRTVHISSFSMLETEVTERQWEEVMGWNDCYDSRGDNYPVEFVSWLDCVSFCNRLSEAVGLQKCYSITNVTYNGVHISTADVICDFESNGFRLPTEAEWEYACRAGSETRFCNGDSEADLMEVAWYTGNSDSDKQKVGQKDANQFGLYDMHGNVWEWCWDWYYNDYYGSRPDPDYDPTGRDEGSDRIQRGGSCYDIIVFCRSAYRSYVSPNNCHRYVGFRVVRSN